MKNILNTCLLLLLLLLLSCAAAQRPILDTNGRPVRVDFQYHIRSASWDIREGDLTADPNNLDTCPLNIVLDNSGRPGVPVTFHVIKAVPGVFVHAYFGLNIQFAMVSNENLCNDSGVWAAGVDPFLGALVVSTGGKLGAASSRFQIKPQGGFYKLAYCTVGVCKDLTILDGQRLGMSFNPFGSHKPLIVTFKRVEADDDATKIKMPTDE